jgi:hypothetical protein
VIGDWDVDLVALEAGQVDGHDELVVVFDEVHGHRLDLRPPLGERLTAPPHVRRVLELSAHAAEKAFQRFERVTACAHA